MRHVRRVEPDGLVDKLGKARRREGGEKKGLGMTSRFSVVASGWMAALFTALTRPGAWADGESWVEQDSEVLFWID
jgi:hypothetical protein